MPKAHGVWAPDGAGRQAARPGEVIVSGPKAGLMVKCGHGALEVLELQAQGGKRMTARAYLAGKRIEVGTRLGKDGEA